MDILNELVLEQAMNIKSSKYKNFSNEESQILKSADDILLHRAITIRDLDGLVEELYPKRITTTDNPKNWQVSDFIPPMQGEKWHETYNELKKDVSYISPELLVVLVADMLTEEGLPTYSALINKPVGIMDHTGVQTNAMSRWLRYWIADENKHGELLKRMLFLSNSLNIREVENSEQNLLSNGFDAGIGQDPYKLIFYTGFQEPATQISHLNTAKLAKKSGSEMLYNICLKIAADESRHASFYQAVGKALFEIDPNNSMTAYAFQMRKGIDMPAQTMTSTYHEPLFDKFSNIARRIKVYTANDYASISAKTNKKYDVEGVSVTTDEAKRAQEYLVRLPAKLERFAPRVDDRTEPFDKKHFPWLK